MNDDDSSWPAAQQTCLEMAASKTCIALAEGNDRLHVRRGLIGRPGMELRTALLTPRRLLHFRDGLVFDGDLDLEVLADLGLAAGAIIEGPVRVGGVLSQNGLPVLAAALIRGDVHARRLVHRDGHLRITGDVHVDHAVWGQYNDGCLDVQGTVYADAWIAGVHDMSAALPLPANTPPPATDALCERHDDADPAVQRIVDLMARPALKARLLESGVDPSLRDASGEDRLEQSLLRDLPGVVALLARRWPHWRPG